MASFAGDRADWDAWLMPRWYVGSIRRSISARSNALGQRIEATWNSDDPAVSAGMGA